MKAKIKEFFSIIGLILIMLLLVVGLLAGVGFDIAKFRAYWKIGSLKEDNIKVESVVRVVPDTWNIYTASWFGTDGRHGTRLPSLSLLNKNKKRVKDYETGVGFNDAPLGDTIVIYSPETGISVEAVVMDRIAECEGRVDMPLWLWKHITGQDSRLGLARVVVLYRKGSK